MGYESEFIGPKMEVNVSLIYKEKDTSNIKLEKLHGINWKLSNDDTLLYEHMLTNNDILLVLRNEESGITRVVTSMKKHLSQDKHCVIEIKRNIDIVTYSDKYKMLCFYSKQEKSIYFYVFTDKYQRGRQDLNIQCDLSKYNWFTKHTNIKCMLFVETKKQILLIDDQNTLRCFDLNINIFERAKETKFDQTYCKYMVTPEGLYT